MFLYILLPAGTVLVVYLISKMMVVFREHTRPLCYKNDIRMDGKTVLITGANSGIGKETAKNLVSRGAKVIMACRNLTKAEAAAEEIRIATGVDPKMVVIVHLDLVNLDSVRECAKKIYATEAKLDVLINNAGLESNVARTTKQGYDYTFGINHVGPFLLTHLLLGLLKKSSPSRIINISSVKHRFVFELDFSREPEEGSDVKYPRLKFYDISKLAQILHTNVLAEKLSQNCITANSMHPGYVSSGIWDSSSGSKIFSRVLKFAGWLAGKIGRTSQDATQTVIYMAIDPSLEKVSGQYFENLDISENLSSLAKDKELAKKMWDVSMDMCGLTKKLE